MSKLANQHIASTEGQARHEAQLLVMSGQVEDALAKVELLQNLGLTHTTGYAEAVKFYESKCAALQQFKAQSSR